MAVRDREEAEVRLLPGAFATVAGGPAGGLLGSAVRALLGGVLDLGRHGRDAVAYRAQELREAADRWTEHVLRLVVARVVEAVMATVDLTDLVRRNVDLDALAAELDVDAIARRVDLDDAAARLDVAAVVARVDPAQVVARLDLDELVTRVDLDAAAARLDLERLVARIDPDRVVARVDLDAAIARVDLVGLARTVIEGVDLPELIRTSTGTLATDAVRSVRSESMRADDAVAGLVDRLLRRAPPGGARPAQ